jgi:hypothetical protein
MRRLFGRSGFSVNDKIQAYLFVPSLKECTVCTLYGWRFRSLCRMRRALLSDMPNAWACLRTDRLGLRPTDTNTRAMFSRVRTEDGRPGGSLHVTAPSSRQCLTYQRIAFGDGASCSFSSRRNPRRVSAMDPVRINSSTATPQRSMSTKFECHCFWDLRSSGI